MFKKKVAKKFWKSSTFPLVGLYRIVNIVSRVFSDTIVSVTYATSPQLIDRLDLVLNLREL